MYDKWSLAASWLRKGMGIVTIHEGFGESHPQPTSVRLIDWWMSWWHPCHRLVSHVISHLRMIPVDSAIDRSNDFAWSLHTEDMIHQLVDCEHPIRIPLSTVFPTIYIYVSQKILPWVTFDIHGYPICPMIIPYLFPYHCWCSQLGAPSPPIFRRTLRHYPPWQCLRPGDPGGPRGDPGIDVVHVVELWVEELGWLVIMVMKQGIRWLLTYC